MGENNRHGYLNWTHLRQSFRKIYRTPIFQSIHRLQTWTLRSLHKPLYWRHLLYQRWADPINNSFRPALKYTWEISDTSLAFLAIKLSIEGNGLSSRVYFKATDSHSCLLYLSSRPLHVKNSIPFSQFLRLRRLSSDDCDFPTYQRQCASFSLNVASKQKDWDEGMRYLKNHSRRYTDLLSFLKGVII